MRRTHRSGLAATVAILCVSAALTAGGGTAASREVTVSSSRGLRHVLGALARGNVTVRLRAGRYRVSPVRLGPGARLYGSGAKTLLLAPRRPYWAVVLVTGRNVQVADLAIDGRGRGGGSGEAVSIQSGSSNVLVQHVRVRHVRRYGVAIWGTHRDVSVQDSIITGTWAADAGVISEESAATARTSVLRSRISRFRRWGINLAQVRYHLAGAGLGAVIADNHVSAIYDRSRADGTDEGGIWTGTVGASILRNTVTGTGWDGIETVGSSDHVTVAANHVSRTRTGIYLEHSTNDSAVTANSIWNVKRGINVEWTYGGVGSARNTFSANRIAGASAVGLFVDTDANGNRIAGNAFVGGRGIVLQGSSNNVVTANRGCGKAASPLVHEQHGRHANGALAAPKGNAIAANVWTASCTGV